jgi:Zinc finger, C2H2 type
MTEPDLPYITPPPELPAETKEEIQPSPDVENPLPTHEPLEDTDTDPLVCPICGRIFKTKTELELHIATIHTQIKKT